MTVKTTPEITAQRLTKTHKGRVWRDSNNHRFTVERVEFDRVNTYGDPEFALYGPMVCDEETNCDGWWQHVHNSPDEFPDYHAQPQAYASKNELRGKRIFGWTRIS